VKISNIQGSHPFEGGIIFVDASYQLAIVPFQSKNPSAPKYQLVYKQEGNPFHDTRLSGLFAIKENLYRGDILLNGKKQPFKLEINKVDNVAIISR